MESHESSESESDDEVWPWRRLDTLPPEIILHICSFLSAKFVICVLSQVCKKLKAIIESDVTWRTRLFKRWPQKYPIVTPVEEINWKSACIAREEQHRLWNNPSENMRKFHIVDAHFGSVNVVQLIQNGKILVSGGRDGYIKLWNLDPLYLMNQPFNLDFDFVDTASCLIDSRQHSNAWLWDTTYDSNQKHLYSCGFDHSIKCWSFEPSLEALTTFNLPSPVLCLAYYGNLLLSGTFGHTVTGFDPRAGSQHVLLHKQHKKPVLCIVADGKYVISGSEDKSVVVYDIVNERVLKKIEFEHFPMSMSYGGGQLLIGDLNGSLHVIDPTNGAFELLHTFPSGHEKKVTGVQHSLGSIITSSTDKTIRILEPHVNPETIAVIESTNEVSRISVYDEILACANVDDSISFWIPSETFDFV